MVVPHSVVVIWFVECSPVLLLTTVSSDAYTKTTVHWFNSHSKEASSRIVVVNEVPAIHSSLQRPKAFAQAISHIVS